jgi:hypothetical protein
MEPMASNLPPLKPVKKETVKMRTHRGVEVFVLNGKQSDDAAGIHRRYFHFWQNLDAPPLRERGKRKRSQRPGDGA